MKQFFVLLFVAFSLAACQTKEVKETHTETVVPAPEPPVTEPATPPATPPPAPQTKEEKQNRVEISVSDTGSGMKIRIP